MGFYEHEIECRQLAEVGSFPGIIPWHHPEASIFLCPPHAVIQHFECRDVR